MCGSQWRWLTDSLKGQARASLHSWNNLILPAHVGDSRYHASKGLFFFARKPSKILEYQRHYSVVQNKEQPSLQWEFSSNSRSTPASKERVRQEAVKWTCGPIARVKMSSSAALVFGEPTLGS